MTTCWKCGDTKHVQPTRPTPGSGERAIILCPPCYVDWLGGYVTGPMADAEADPRQASMFDLMEEDNR